MQDNVLIPLIINTLIAGEAAAGISGTPVKQAWQPTAQGANSQPTAYLHKIGDRRYGFVQRTDSWQPVQTAAFTGSISGTALTVTAVSTGTIGLGDVVAGDSIPVAVTIASFGSGSGGTGTYTISEYLTVGSETMTASAPTMVHTETQQYESTFQISVLATQNPATPSQYTASDICNLCASILQSSTAIETFEAQGVGIERVTEVRNPYFLDDREQFEASPSFDFTLTHRQIVVSTIPIAQSIDLEMYTV